jgi:hypothetical protein
MGVNAHTNAGVRHKIGMIFRDLFDDIIGNRLVEAGLKCRSVAYPSA